MGTCGVRCKCIMTIRCESMKHQEGKHRPWKSTMRGVESVFKSVQILYHGTGHNNYTAVAYCPGIYSMECISAVVLVL